MVRDPSPHNRDLPESFLLVHRLLLRSRRCQRPATPRTRPGPRRPPTRTRPRGHLDRLEHIAIKQMFSNREHIPLRTIRLHHARQDRPELRVLRRRPPTRAVVVVSTSRVNKTREGHDRGHAQRSPIRARRTSSARASAVPLACWALASASEGLQVDTACTLVICVCRSWNHRSSTDTSSAPASARWPERCTQIATAVRPIASRLSTCCCSSSCLPTTHSHPARRASPRSPTSACRTPRPSGARLWGRPSN
jgi:hypothetical protein